MAVTKGHFYSVQTERTCVSAANLGTRYVVGWASLWCSDWLLVKPEEEGGSNPCTERPIWAASRAACGGRGETMELPGFTLSSDRWRIQTNIPHASGDVQEDQWRELTRFHFNCPGCPSPRSVTRRTGALHLLMPGAQSRVRGWSESSPRIVLQSLWRIWA